MTDLSWIDRLRLAVDVLRSPASYFDPVAEADDHRGLVPPSDVSLTDLIGVRADISNLVTPSSVHELLEHKIGEQLGLRGPAGRESLAAARDFACPSGKPA
jgi:hypothetical protein